MVFDAVILDATVGEDAGNFRIATHNNLAMLNILTLALRQNSLLAENAILIANHIGGLLYNPEKSLAATFAELNMVVAEDGMVIEI